jgi:hypothetical protein
MSTITGVAGTSVASVCTVPSPNALATNTGLQTFAQGIENDVATLALVNVSRTLRVGYDQVGAHLSDADHTLDVSQGDRFTLAPNGSTGPSVARVITLKDSSPAPAAGQKITLFCHGANSHDGSNICFTVKTSTGPTVIAYVLEFETGAVDQWWATFEFTTTWVLAESSGTVATYDGADNVFSGVRLP